MKRTLFITCALIVLGLLTAGFVYSESFEEYKARLRSEVRNEMGIDTTVRKTVPSIPAPSAQVKKTVTKTVTKQAGISKSVRDKLNEITVLEKVNYAAASKAVFSIMIIALIPAITAKVKGRSFIAWYVLGLLFFIIVFPVSVFMRRT